MSTRRGGAGGRGGYEGGRGNSNASRSPAAAVNYDVIQDPEVRKHILREAQIKSRLGEIRVQMKKLSDEKDVLVRKHEPKREKVLSDIDKKWDQLMTQKSTLHAKLDQLKIHDNSVGQMQDELRLLDFEFGPINKAIQQADKDLKEARRRAQQLSEQREAFLSKLEFKSAADADQEISRIDKKLAAAQSRGDNGQINILVKAKSQAERSKKDVLQSYTIDDNIIAEQAKITRLEEFFQAKVKERDSHEAKKRALRDKITQIREADGKDAFNTIRNELRTVIEKIDELRAKRSSAKPAVTGEEDKEFQRITVELGQLRNERDTINAELDTIKASLPRLEVEFDPELRGELVGPSGATIQQLSKDFGVVLLLDSEGAGKVELIGGQEHIEAAKSAITSMMERIAQSKKSITLNFDARLSREIIGSQGSNIERLQSQSGAKIQVSNTEGTIKIVGTQESIDMAAAMINEFLSKSHREEIKFDPELTDYLIGRGGKTVRQIESESGAKHIKVDRDARLITIIGTAEAVEAAKKSYLDLINGLVNCLRIKIDDKMVRVIIGKGGATIRDIEEKSLAIVTIKNDVLTIRGATANVQKARTMIEDLIRREEIKIPFDAPLYAVLTRRPESPQPGASTRADNDEEGEEEENEEAGDEAEAAAEAPLTVSMLEDIKLKCSCDQISAIRSENKIVIRGKRECVRQARNMVEDLLKSLKLTTATVPFPAVLFNHLVRKDDAGDSPVSRLRANIPGCEGITVSKRDSMIEICGKSDATRDATLQAQKMVDDCAAKIVRIRLTDPGAAGAVVGVGGKTIMELQSRTKTDINVDRTANEVQIFTLVEDSAKAAEEEVKAIIAKNAAAPRSRN